MKKLLLAFLLFSQAAFGQDGRSFDWRKIKYKTAKAYLFGLDGHQSSIVKNGYLNPSVIDTVGILLTEAQVNRVIKAVTSENTEEELVQGNCFIPHHGFVFLDERNHPIGWISVCFYCNRVELYPKTNSPEKGIDTLKQVATELKLPVFKHPMEYFEYGKKLKKD